MTLDGATVLSRVISFFVQILGVKNPPAEKREDLFFIGFSFAFRSADRLAIRPRLSG